MATRGAPLSGNFGQLLKLKAKYPKLKVLLSLGGWTCPSTSRTPRSPHSRGARSFSPVWTCSSRATCRPGLGDGGRRLRRLRPRLGVARQRGQRGQHHPARGQGELHAVAGRVPRQLDAYGRETAGDVRADRVPARGTGEDLRGLRGQPRSSTPSTSPRCRAMTSTARWESVTNHQSAIRVPAGAPVPRRLQHRRRRERLAGGRSPAGEAGDRHPVLRPGLDRGQRRRRRALPDRRPGPAPGPSAPAPRTTRCSPRWPVSGFQVHRDLRAGHAWLFDGTTFWTFDDPLVVLQKALYIRARGSAARWSGSSPAMTPTPP